MTACKTIREQLNRFLDNDLDSRIAARLAAHLSVCQACCHEFERLRDVRDGVRALPNAASDRPAQSRVFDRLEQAARVSPRPVRRAWAISLRRPALASLTAAGMVAAALAFSMVTVTPPLPAPTTFSLPPQEEMSRLYQLNDAHGAALPGDEPLVRRDLAAEARADLMDAADSAASGTL